MPLMRTLLLCSLLTSLPPPPVGAAGVPAEDNFISHLRVNSTISNAKFSHVSSDIQNKASDVKPSRKLNKIIELTHVLSDDDCNNCLECMEKALDVSKNFSQIFANIHSKTGLSQKQIKTKKTKRNIDYLNNTELLEDSTYKSVRVTKYKTAEDKVYAIKVNEINNQVSELNIGKPTCKVYSVKKAFPCESEGSNSILMKRKVNKKKVPKQKNTSTERSVLVTSMFKTRKVLVETAQVPESFMPSIEELY